MMTSLAAVVAVIIWGIFALICGFIWVLMTKNEEDAAAGVLGAEAVPRIQKLTSITVTANHILYKQWGSDADTKICPIDRPIEWIAKLIAEFPIRLILLAQVHNDDQQNLVTEFFAETVVASKDRVNVLFSSLEASRNPMVRQLGPALHFEPSSNVCASMLTNRIDGLVDVSHLSSQESRDLIYAVCLQRFGPKPDGAP